MSFYGNVSNASKTQLVFDRIYANRAAMDEAVNKGNGTDGIFVNRLVLIEYDDNTHSRRPGYLKSRPSEDGIYQIFKENAKLVNEFKENTEKLCKINSSDTKYNCPQGRKRREK